MKLGILRGSGRFVRAPAQPLTGTALEDDRDDEPLLAADALQCLVKSLVRAGDKDLDGVALAERTRL